jgi:microcystin-dependent protein
LHSHSVGAQNVPLSSLQMPGPTVTLDHPASGNLFDTNTTLVQMSDSSLAPAGGDQPHNNLMPYLTLNFCIALQGVYPPRT